MINYLKMKVGYLEVISYIVNNKNSSINFTLRCNNCKEDIDIKIDRQKATRIKCKHCSGTLFMIAVSEKSENGIPDNIIVISEYKYRRLRKQYSNDNTELSWIDWVSNKYNNREGM